MGAARVISRKSLTRRSLKRAAPRAEQSVQTSTPVLSVRELTKEFRSCTGLLDKIPSRPRLRPIEGGRRALPSTLLPRNARACGRIGVWKIHAWALRPEIWFDPAAARSGFVVRNLSVWVA